MAETIEIKTLSDMIAELYRRVNFLEQRQLVRKVAFPVPSLTTTERDALSPNNGDIIYNTTLNKFQGYENGSWSNLI